MRGMIGWLFVLLLAVTIFALSNTGAVTVMFWQWPLYTGPLALVIIGAGLIGALGTLLPSLLRQSRLGSRIRELERERKAPEDASRQPVGTGASYPSGPPPQGRSESTSRIEDTRRLP